jgi:hypothetical protein
VKRLLSRTSLLSLLPRSQPSLGAGFMPNRSESPMQCHNKDPCPLCPIEPQRLFPKVDIHRRTINAYPRAIALPLVYPRSLSHSFPWVNAMPAPSPSFPCSIVAVLVVEKHYSFRQETRKHDGICSMSVQYVGTRRRRCDEG